jgi:hypothetical protein
VSDATERDNEIARSHCCEQTTVDQVQATLLHIVKSNDVVGIAGIDESREFSCNAGTETAHGAQYVSWRTMALLTRTSCNTSPTRSTLEVGPSDIAAMGAGALDSRSKERSLGRQFTTLLKSHGPLCTTR